MKDTVASRFSAGDSERQSSLHVARTCAALTDPTILPWDCPHPSSNTDTRALTQSFQSDGAYGLLNMAGKLMLALFGQHWFQLSLAPELWYSPDLADEAKQAADQRLFLWELIGSAKLQATNIVATSAGQRFPVGFLSRKLAALNQLLVTGDVLEMLGDDYAMRVYRRDQYVTLRDSSGAVCHHAIRERLDPLGLPEDQFAASGLDRDEMMRTDTRGRIRDVYTLVEWQPWAKTWLIRVETNDHTIHEREEKVSPYFSTPFKLTGGENYGRGFVETACFGDLVTLNELELRLLELLAMASKRIIATDVSSLVRDKDLAKPSGSTIKARVVNGQVQDIGAVEFASVADYNMLVNGVQRKALAVRRAFLVESSIQPTGDRVTAQAIQRVTAEVEGALGGSYVPIADFQQLPLLQRLFHQLRRDRLVPVMPNDSVRISSLTGLAALFRAGEANRLLTFTQTIAALGPEAVRYLNMGALIGAYQRLSAIYQPGLIKSEAELAKEANAAVQQQIALAAGQQAAKTAGAIVEQQVAAGTPAQ
jgi:hypothetical protein